MGSAGVMLTLVDRGLAAGQDITVIYSPVRASSEFIARAGGTAGVRFIPLTMHRSLGLHDLFAWARLRAILRRERFDVVHSHSSKAGALARLAGIGGRSTQVYSPHGFFTMADGVPRAYGVIERFLALFADTIVAVSRKEMEHGLSLGIDDRRIVIVPNGIATDFAAGASDPIPDRKHFTVGFVGRFCDQKDPVLALEAFRHLLDVRPDSRMIMIGDGELAEAVTARVDALGLGDSVDRPGACSALPFYPHMDVLLCSSRFEGMPLTFLEALNHGLPIVSTDVGGVDELIDPGKTGFVCAGSAEALGARLVALASYSPAERLLMRERSFAQGRQFSADAMFNRMAILYRDRPRSPRMHSSLRAAG